MLEEKAPNKSGKKQNAIVSWLSDIATITVTIEKKQGAYKTEWNRAKIQTDYSLNLFRHFNLYISHTSRTQILHTYTHSAVWI